MEQIIGFIKELMSNNFFGTVEIQFRAGTPTIIRKTETILVEQENGKTDENA